MASTGLEELYAFEKTLSPLNEASMATIYRARDSRDSQVCAIKQINKARLLELHPTRRAKILERLQYEVDAHREVTRLGAPGVCALKECIETPNVVYLVMELCPGRQLFDVVAQSPGGHLSEPLAAELFRQLIDGCQAIHDAGYIHRDLKPENVLCVPVGGGGDGHYVTKIVDFGAAKPLQNMLTASVSGTSVWNLSPERGYGEAESTSADVWALGATLFFMLTGNSPFHNLGDGDADDSAVLDRVLDEELVWPADPPVSEAARDLVEHMLQKEAEDRPALSDLQRSEWVQQPPPAR